MARGWGASCWQYSTHQTPREETESQWGDRSWLKIETEHRKGASGSSTAKGGWLGSELVSASQQHTLREPLGRGQ